MDKPRITYSYGEYLGGQRYRAIVEHNGIKCVGFGSYPYEAIQRAWIQYVLS